MDRRQYYIFLGLMFVSLVLTGFFFVLNENNLGDAKDMSIRAETYSLNVKNDINNSLEKDTIVKLNVYPEKVRPGDVLLITGEITSTCSISRASLDIYYENGFDTENFFLEKVENKTSFLKAAWVVHNTKDKTEYPIVAHIFTECGDEIKETTHYFDPTVSHTADQIEPGTFSTGDYTFPNSLTIQNNLQVNGKVTGELEADKATISTLLSEKIGIGVTSPQGKFQVVGELASNVEDSPGTINLDNIGFPAELPKLVDINTLTPSWNTDDASSGAYLKIDMGSNNEKDYVKLMLYASSAGYTGSFSIDYSDDGSAWSTAASSFIPQFEGWNKITWSSKGPHRYWRIYMDSTQSGYTFNELQLFVSDSGTAYIINDDGTVGIGTAETLDNKVRIYEDSRPSILLVESDGDNTYFVADHDTVHKGGLIVKNNGIEKWTIINDGLDNNKLKISSSSKTPVVISQDGSVGINENNPTHPLEVKGDAILLSGTTIAKHKIVANTAQIDLYEADSEDKNTQLESDNNALHINTVDESGQLVEQRVKVDHSTGNVGIDDDDPQHKLSVNGEIGVNEKIEIGSDSKISINGTEITFPDKTFIRSNLVKSVLEMAPSTYTSNCALLDDHSVKCWGHNNYHQLGVGTDGSQRNLPARIPIENVKTLVNGYTHVCAVKLDKTVWCWGYNGYGQLGTGDTNYRYTPTKISSLSNVKDIVIGGTTDAHTCALKGDGTVWCWGYNGYGQLGSGDTNNKYSPIQVSGLSNVKQLATHTNGYEYTCALKGDGTVWCWGYNGYGQLGDGSTSSKYSPVQAQNINNAKKIKVGGTSGGTTCALLEDDKMKCWGYNGYGQVGDGTTSYKTTPNNVNSLTAVKDFDMSNGADAGFVCAIYSDNNNVKCWGYNGNGQLGDGSTTNRYTAINAQGLSNVKQIAVVGTDSSGSSCALKYDGTVWCWGYNGHGETGYGDTNGGKYIPRQVKGLSNVRKIYSGGYSSSTFFCAVLNDGRALCWGYNGHGQLGMGTTSPSYCTTPTFVKSLNID